MCIQKNAVGEIVCRLRDRIDILDISNIYFGHSMDIALDIADIYVARYRLRYSM